MPKKSTKRKTKVKGKIEVMTVEMYKKEEAFLQPKKLIQLVFDFYTMPLE